MPTADSCFDTKVKCYRQHDTDTDSGMASTSHEMACATDRHRRRIDVYTNEMHIYISCTAIVMYIFI